MNADHSMSTANRGWTDGIPEGQTEIDLPVGTLFVVYYPPPDFVTANPVTRGWHKVRYRVVMSYSIRDPKHRQPKQRSYQVLDGPKALTESEISRFVNQA